MSTKTPVQENNATYEELAEFSAASNVSATPASPEQNRNAFYRIFALLFALAPVVVLCLFNVTVLSFKGGLALEEYKLLDFFSKLFREDGFAVTKLFRLLPITCDTSSIWGLFHNGMLYLIPVSMAACVTAGVVAFFSRKHAPTIARAILFVEILVYTGYIASVAVPYYCNGTGFWKTVDLAVYATAAGAFLMYFVLAFARSGKRAFASLLIFLLTAASAGVIVYAYCAKHVAIRALAAGNIPYKLAILSIPCVYLLFVLHSFVAISAKKVRCIDMLRCVLMLLMGFGAIMVSFLANRLSGCLLYGIIETAIALAMLIIATIVVKENKKKETELQEEANEEKEEAEEAAPYTEESAPAVAAPVAKEESAPVAEEEPATVEESAPAQEVANEVVPAAAEENDVYGGEFDAFIATLTSEERMQFTQIFLLRTEAKLPGIPEYKIGGDNKTFFRKIFVNLGSLRARIPDDLMEKIYQFSVRQ